MAKEMRDLEDIIYDFKEGYILMEELIPEIRDLLLKELPKKKGGEIIPTIRDDLDDAYNQCLSEVKEAIKKVCR